MSKTLPTASTGDIFSNLIAASPATRATRSGPPDTEE
ncbi:hypothetical protein LOK49_LG05G01144 [Camellia lanceoleosa]|uniref:Uncharacterized protein n=1 Tax=Camellia lanceoleosa TaxID=1840588 RepID=A0ACC0HNW2_9ERIC|nr:hypothetical protein LOK49_LG05G01144 [Camellia lanceoleosa]